MRLDCFPDAPPQWDRVVVDAFAKVAPRYRLDKSKEYPFVEMAAVAEQFGGITRWEWRKPESSGLARFKKNDILFGKITPCAENGKVALVRDWPTDFGLGSTEFIVLSPRERVDPRWAYAVLCANPVLGRAISRMEGSTGRLRVTEDTFTKWLYVPLPSPSEQAGIAKILDATDTAIERTRAALDDARRVESGVLHALLTCGIDLRRGIRKREERPSEFTALRWGWYPTAWEASSVAEEFDLATGFTLGEHRRPRLNRRRYLRVANVQRGYIVLDDVAELEAKDREMVDRTLALDDMLIVEGHADPYQIGRCARVPAEAVGLTFQNHLYRLRCRRLDPRFAELWMNSQESRRYWQRMCSTSSGLNTINQRKLKAMPIFVPEPDEQKRIADIARCHRIHVAALESEVSRMERLRRGLMQDLLTGRVRTGVAGSAVLDADGALSGSEPTRRPRAAAGVAAR
ncbi:MAG: restriction endonuclease subunit S [Phycisphaerales bacterium]|nr:restriction endonuclease subunit S [Phycisphaerales bacterium]